MMVLRLFGTEVWLHWSLWLLFGLLAAVPYSLLLWLGLAAAVCHELGHLFALLAAGGRLRSLRLGLLGGKMQAEEKLCLGAELFSTAAGPAVNLLLALLFGMAWQMGGRLFSAINLVLGIFNLLPVQGMDGGRLLRLMLELKFPLYTAEKISVWASCISLVFLAVWAVFLWQKHPHLPTILLFPLVPLAAFFIWWND